MSDNSKDGVTSFTSAAKQKFGFDELSAMFNKPFGPAMLQFGVITQDQFDQAGRFQALTIVLAKLIDSHGIEAVKTASPEPIIPMKTLFDDNLTADEKEETLLDAIKNTSEALGEDFEALNTKALADVNNALENEGSVHSNAAPIGAIHKGLFLKGKERGMIPNAFFGMQFSLRALGVLRTWEKTPNEAMTVAQNVMNQNNKLNPGESNPDEKYFADPPWVQEAHYALRTISNIVIGARGRELMPHEEAGMDHSKKQIIAAMENSARMFEAVDQPFLAEMGRSLREEMGLNYLNLDTDEFGAATPEAFEKMWAEAGKKPNGNSPHTYLMNLVA